MGFAALALGLLPGLPGCRVPPGGGGRAPSSTRGVILISLDTLRADRLVSYGYDLPTSPFIDRLAQRGTLFENVAAPYPATLVSHMSMFTGLYPPEHGVYPPAGVLPETAWTAAEGFRAAGFRTAAHTEGGFVAKGYGFERGFEVYDDSAEGGESDIETTLRRGLEFLDGLEPEERFYLFLHSYSIHDPYDPPDRFAGQFDGSDPPPNSSGERLRDFNHERAVIERTEVERFSKRYDASVRYADAMLESFVSELEQRGLLEDTTLVITSDHGEEFLEHGKLAHTQLYPEVLAVPLVIVHPDQSTARRVSDQVSLVDVAPTLVELAGLAPPEGLAGISLVSYLHGTEPEQRRPSYAEVDDAKYLRSLIGEVEGARYQLLVEAGRPDEEGVWVAEKVESDVFGARLALRSRSFHQARRVTVRVGGEVVGDFVTTPDWAEYTFDLADSGLSRIELETDGCTRPRDVSDSGDSRCLSFIVQSPPLMTAQLFDLDRDPAALVDVSRELPLVTRRMMRELQAKELAAVGAATVRELSDEDRRRLKDLGYLD